MARKQASGQKEEKRSPIRIKPIPRKSGGKVTEPWATMEGLLQNEATFKSISHCRVRLWWQKDSKADADGIAVGATVCKANEIDRALVEDSEGGTRETPDVFIKLAEKCWQQSTPARREQLLFHELCHIHRAQDANGEQKRDTKGRLLWRIGRHPIQTFHAELAKYGAEAVIGSNQAVLDAMRAADEPLLAEAAKAGKK